MPTSEQIGNYFSNLKDRIQPLLSDKKKLISFLILGILILSLPIGIYLIRQQQIFKSRAAVEPITFIASDSEYQNNSGQWVTTKAQILLKLTSPLIYNPQGTPTPSESPASFCAQVITAARNPANGECQKFPTPCDVPSGWQTIADCSAPSQSAAPVRIPNPVSEPKIISYGAFSYTTSADSVQHISQSILADNGYAYGRTCIIENGQQNCDGSRFPWTKIAVATPDGSGTKIIAYGAFSYYSNGQQKAVQSLIGEDGTSFSRTCDVGPNDLNLSATACSWKKDPNKLGIPMPDQPAGKIIGYEAFSYKTSADGKEHVSMSLLADNGYSYGRTCNVDDSGNLNCSASTSPWSRVAVDSKVIAYGAFSYYAGDQQKVVQSLINNDGSTSYRICDIGSNGLNLSATVCPWQYGTISVPSVLGISKIAQAPDGTQKPTPTGPTVSYRIAESPADLANANWQNYTGDGMVVNYEFVNKTPGIKYVFVQFKDSGGKESSPADCPKCQISIELLNPVPVTGGVNIPILVLNYFPLDSTGQNLDPAETGTGATLASMRTYVSGLTQQAITQMSEGSKYHGYKNPSAPALFSFSVADTKEFLIKLPRLNPAATSQNPSQPDYRQMLENANICDYVDNQGVRQVWLYGYHQGSVYPVESDMSMGRLSQSYWNQGTFGDVSNSARIDDMPVCNHTYTLFNYNYTRGVAELVEDHTHHIEALLNFVDTNLFWYLFVSPFGKTGGVVNHCGWTHYPPNAASDYDWRNERSVSSDCEDWHPDGSGTVSTYTCHTVYGATCIDDSGLKFKIWWMQNIPGIESGLTYQGNSLRNWLEFYADFDGALAKGKALTVGASTPVPTPTPAPITNKNCAMNCVYAVNQGNDPTSWPLLSKVFVNSTDCTIATNICSQTGRFGLQYINWTENSDGTGRSGRFELFTTDVTGRPRISIYQNSTSLPTSMTPIPSSTPFSSSVPLIRTTSTPSPSSQVITSSVNRTNKINAPTQAPVQTQAPSAFQLIQQKAQPGATTNPSPESSTAVAGAPSNVPLVGGLIDFITNTARNILAAWRQIQ